MVENKKEVFKDSFVKEGKSFIHILGASLIASMVVWMSVSSKDVLLKSGILMLLSAFMMMFVISVLLYLIALIVNKGLKKRGL